MKGWTSQAVVAKGLALSPRPSTDEAKLNRLEREWLRILRFRENAGTIYVQAFTLKLADDCRYSPDFLVVHPDGTATFHEVKGFMRDDAQVKLKVAARQFPMFRFVLVTKAGGRFSEVEVKP